MLRRGRPRRRESHLPLWPRLATLGVVLSVSFLLAGLFADLGPPKPVGELVRGTVLAVQPDGDGRPATVLVRVDAPGGPVLCGMGRPAFTDGRLPAAQEQITVDYTPAGCAPEPVSEKLPRWFFLTFGVGGVVLLAVYFWLVGPITYDRFVDAWTRGYFGSNWR